ncbi:uncharacterized protein Z520_05619 [Fonsecaea multimorphosa CBS 102226]|uniref:Uncharacterized protein n=1 Tax=Fonsecaea multimorphosa CBS 102226 TaxID=1442371 RepID=A0A0D2KNN7_9EURO|nr:uncharacterized protein Z520_05619 [Fonsecaea multimorphosa CBS 102226]KIX98318.1 hypothetical protein Z520_05619 [Fonsecaea multimorphosa CBS 102226]OAL24513.1 hypothetical protein AYO22_05302 [Fonsecaea multimorphosa]
MESDTRRPKNLVSFSERVAAFLTNRQSWTLPSQEEILVEKNGTPSVGFRNELPLEQNDIRNSFIRRQYDTPEEESRLDPELLANENLIQTVLLPATIICVPIALLAATLLALIYMYKVQPVPSLFNPTEASVHGPGFVLVNFAATRLVFVASFLSTLAPLLGSFILSVFALPVSRRLRDASREAKYLNLPTPFQMSLLIGILVASAQQLRSYLWYLVRRRRPSIPPVLHCAASMMLLSLLMAAAVFVADTILHYTTSTVEFDQISVPPQPNQEFGRGLSEFCLTFNRTFVGFPCSDTTDSGVVDPNANFEATETNRLFHNTSQLSEIRITATDDVPGADLAYLIPQQESIVPNTDYEASTIGISTTCRFVNPASCGMVLWDDYYTNFSCTDMFHGTIGMPPIVSTSLLDPRPPDPYRSFLMYKGAANLMYSFFSDSGMKNIYNTVGYNDSGLFDLSISPYPNSELVNPFYVGIAARISTTSGQFVSGSEMMAPNNNATFLSDGVLDFILNCAVASYNVSYTWVDGRLQSINAVPTGNGSVLEIYHGSLLYATISGGDSDLQDFLTQSALAGDTTESFLQKFGSLYSTKVLAEIGGYTTGRLALAQQLREHMLLSKVPIPPLAMLVALSFCYPLLGLILAVQAYWASRGNVRDIAAKLSLLGLSQAAFGDKQTGASTNGTTSREEVSRVLTQETRRILVDGSAQQGFEFGVML